MTAQADRKGSDSGPNPTQCPVWFGMGSEGGDVGQCELVIGHKGLHKLTKPTDQKPHTDEADLREPFDKALAILLKERRDMDGESWDATDFGEAIDLIESGLAALDTEAARNTEEKERIRILARQEGYQAGVLMNREWDSEAKKRIADKLRYCEHKMSNGDIWFSSAVQDVINELSAHSPREEAAEEDSPK